MGKVVKRKLLTPDCARLFLKYKKAIDKAKEQLEKDYTDMEKEWKKRSKRLLKGGKKVKGIRELIEYLKFKVWWRLNKTKLLKGIENER